MSMFLVLLLQLHLIAGAPGPGLAGLSAAPPAQNPAVDQPVQDAGAPGAQDPSAAKPAEAASPQSEQATTPVPDGSAPPLGAHQGARKRHGKHSSRLSDEPVPLRRDLVPDRPKPILELGEPFLGTGVLDPGFRLPTGAVWQPALIVFGTLRTAVQSNGYSPTLGDARTTEGVSRLDLFGNLALSGSERLVLGFRNLDKDGSFTGHIFESDTLEEGGTDALNADVSSLFFEGDIGEIFPNLSPRDFAPTDIGFSVGRQPLFFQEGMLINDSIDGLGMTFNSLQPRNTSNWRTTVFYGWGNADRNGVNADTGQLFAVLTSMDRQKSTVEVDLAYSTGEDAADPLAAFGISAVQRLGFLNSSFRILGSKIDNDAPKNEGLLLFSELSYTPHGTRNLVYCNSFWAVDNYTPVAIGAGFGGALGRAGINFAGVGIGAYGAPLSPAARDVAGSAFGYQFFFDETRKQLLVELAARVGLEDDIKDQYGLTARYQMAMGRHFVWILDAFVNRQERFDNDNFYGGRLELQVEF